ncbi:Chitin synthase, class 3 [Agyrium rufum]|nr:Chitin synthase, class 3 [Agyrium rufum]
MSYQPTNQESPRRERRHSRRESYRDSPVRRPHRRDVEEGAYYDEPYSPSKRPRQAAYIEPPSPATPGLDRDFRMASPVQSQMDRKRSLVRPERGRIDRDHPNYYYRQHAQNMMVYPSTTGNDPITEDLEEVATNSSDELEKTSLEQVDTPEPGVEEPLASDRKRRRRRKSRSTKEPRRLQRKTTNRDGTLTEEEKSRRRERESVRPPNLWNVYCAFITFWCPSPVLACLGKPSKAQQRAWREKMGLISIILLIGAFVGFLTFGFTQAVCGTPKQNFKVNTVGSDSMIFHGEVYNMNSMQHPGAEGIPDGTNVLYDLPHKYGGQDGSFMFQNVNGACKGLITVANGSKVPTDNDGNLAWYFPCTAFNQDGHSEPNYTFPYYEGYACHTTTFSRTAFTDYFRSSGDLSFSWSDIKNSSRRLTVYSGSVLDLDLLNWFDTTQVTPNPAFADLANNPAAWGIDLTHLFQSGEQKQLGQCMSQIIKVGSIDTDTVGCIASEVVLYVSLTFILSLVLVKFFLALAFQWFFSRRYSAAKSSITSNPKEKAAQIEEWTEDIYRPPPKLIEGSSVAGSRRTSMFPTTSRFTSPYITERSQVKTRPNPTTMAGQSSAAKLLQPGGNIYKQSDISDTTLPSFDPSHRQSLGGSRSSLIMSGSNPEKRMSTAALSDMEGSGPSGFIHEAVVPQPPPEWQPFGYPLAHAICLVTAYSEGEEGLRTTLDSIATTEYPNSHKTILVVCDGMVKGHGEEMTTPDIALSMLYDHATLPDEVQAFSYVAVASGSKRHNMAKVYAGYYKYNEGSRVPLKKQQRVPMMVIVKCGTPDELNKSKPGNRGKRDSQIILMSFLQKVMFDERMTELEFEMFNGLWKITGISPDFYEMVLMVDADTKVFPDSLTHMVSAMVKDPEIMGLCGETKIANKRVSWVTMIQVFEYFISHHLSKSFESVFGGVTCLPGCFCMYRIKAPKGGQNYWVPILANPDVVEHYSENVVDTLHKKNLLLLGEDRYLSTTMLKTFPKRKQVFVPQAVCKTTVPEQFSVLLSQRRRWINSTVHNLMELVLVRDLCGTFCFSMQFVVFIELIGTLVLPAAIAFTFYLIVISIVRKPVPVIPLILLALILGLPAFLIVLTAHRWSYVVWMLIYLLSLPIWNFVLPINAYWKFDDFSWGDTRKTAGEKTKKAGLEYEGEFDSSKITMKRWGDFEKERRLKESTTGYSATQQTSTAGWQSQYQGYESDY